jgi:poly(3-hydroxybutyrate) depolymerase
MRALLPFLLTSAWLLPATATAAAPVAELPLCTPGEHKLVIEVGGVSRDAIVIVGPRVGKSPVPVLFAWHGFGATPELMAKGIRAPEFWADSLVVLPRGLPRSFKQFGPIERLGWQVALAEHAGRDLAFFDALVARLGKQPCVDKARLYSSGFSNGGFFSNLLGCHRGAVLAAIAPVGGGGPFEPKCGPRVPTRVAHGSDDNVVPFDFAQKSVAHWSQHNTCKTPPPPQNPGTGPGAPGSCAQASCDAKAPVTFCAYKGAHIWGGRPQAEGVSTFLKSFKK